MTPDEPNRTPTTREEALEDAVIWMSGSADFAPGGMAHEGFEKIVRPLLETMGDHKEAT